MKVLIVDDESLIRRSLQRAFEKSGHEVHLAEDGVQGVSQWKALKPDAVVLDVLMPGHTGPEVIEEVKPNESVVVVLISAFSGEYNPDAVKQLGADRFIAKPFSDIKEVVEAVEEIAKGKKS